jgi:hypothetical protein
LCHPGFLPAIPNHKGSASGVGPSHRSHRLLKKCALTVRSDMDRRAHLGYDGVS